MKLLSLFFAVLLLCNSAIGSTHFVLMRNLTTTGYGHLIEFNGVFGTTQCYGTTTAGSGAATILVEVSNFPTPTTSNGDWVEAATIELTLGTTQTSDGFAMQAPWKWIRARVSAISGTGASVSCHLVRGN